MCISQEHILLHTFLKHKDQKEVAPHSLRKSPAPSLVLPPFIFTI